MSTTSNTKEKRESKMILYREESWQEFLYILKTISLVHNKVQLMLDGDSITIHQMDSSHISMIEVTFEDIATENLRLTDDGTNESITLDVHDLYKTLKGMKTYANMTAIITISRTSEMLAKLKVELKRSSDAKTYDEFLVKLEIDNATPDIPQVNSEMPIHFEMEADLYSYMIKTMNAASTTHIEMSGSAIEKTLTVEGVDLSSTRTATRTSTVELLSINENFGELGKACYHLDYMSVLKYVDMFAVRVQVDLDVGKPIRIHTKPRLPFEMTYWVAPRLENS